MILTDVRNRFVSPLGAQHMTSVCILNFKTCPEPVPYSTGHANVFFYVEVNDIFSQVCVEQAHQTGTAIS
jgi:hypothetical protein